MPHAVFVSHAWQDAKTADALWQALRGHVDAWIDTRHLELGEPWRPAIEAALAQARVFVALVSPHSNRALYQEAEIQRAIALYRREPDRKIIPLMAGVNPHDLPLGLGIFQGLTLESDGALDGVAKRIVELVHSLGTALPAPTETAMPPLVAALTGGSTDSVHILRSYPTGPVVDWFRIDQTVLNAFISRYPPAEALELINAANRFRMKAEPKDTPPGNRIIHEAQLLGNTVPGAAWWERVVDLARKSPRMLAALLLSLADDKAREALGDAEQRAVLELLEYLRTQHGRA